MSDPRALLAKADKLAASASGGFSFFGGKGDKLEQAAEAYSQAANAFRIANQGHEAGQTFEKAAQTQLKIDEKNDAANSMIEAFKSYKRTSPEDAARCLEEAIKHYAISGNLRRAATYKQNLAELFEVDVNDQKRAIEAYETAGEWYLSDNAEALANKVFLKVADIAALLKDYEKAIQRYEQVAAASANNNLMKWSLKDYFLKAGICHLATKDIVTAKRQLEKYVEMDMGFMQTREYQLLVDLIQAVETQDNELFEEKLFQFDQVAKLDKWKTTLLLRIKQDIEAEDEDLR